MNDHESAEETAFAKDAGAPQRELDRLSKMPLNVLLYYVLHADEYLTRLKV